MNDVPTSITRPTLVGWLARLVSIALMITLLLPIVFRAATLDTETQFVVTRSTVDTRKVGAVWYVPITIENLGSQSASDVDLEVELDNKKTDVHIDLIGASEEREYILVTETRPESLTYRLIKFEAP